MNIDDLILHISVECYPAAKVGGLADVVGALPKYQQALGEGAAVIMPWYNNDWFQECNYRVVHSGYIEVGFNARPFDVRKIETDELPTLYAIYFPDGPNPKDIYHDQDIRNDLFAWFLKFQLSVMEWLLQKEHQPRLVHCHDHHTGLVPFMMTRCFRYQKLASIPTVLTVHNGAYHGAVELPRFQELPAFNQDDIGLLEWDHQLNPLAAGIKCAWRVTTVSEGYLNELVNGNDELSHLYQLEEEKCEGIINGIDTEVWDPNKDPLIDTPFTNHSIQEWKKQNKQNLAERYNFDPAKPLITYIGRLEYEKGADLLPELLDSLDHDIELPKYQFFVLGSGNTELEQRLKQTAKHYSDSISLYIGYNEALAHQLYASSDYIFMPSRVEPCGLNQMYAMRYATIPIVRAVGGLKDTVTNLNDSPTGQGEGFTFSDFSVEASHGAIQEALLLYHSREDFEAIRQRISQLNFSWQQAAQKYIDLYNQLT